MASDKQKALDAGDLRRVLEKKSISGKQQVCPHTQTDKARGYQVHANPDEIRKQENFDQKIYLFPPMYNELRRELHDHWPQLWALTAWRMAYKAEEFVEYLNSATDLNLVVDSESVDWTCEQYLTKLRQMRGLKW